MLMLVREFYDWLDEICGFIAHQEQSLFDMLPTVEHVGAERCEIELSCDYESR